MTGLSDGAGSGVDYLTREYRASDGLALWGRRTNGTGNSLDAASGIAVSPDGKKVFVTGESVGPGPNFRFDFLTCAFSAV